MNNKERVSLKIRCLEAHFEKYRDMWENEHKDDRALFCGIYDQLIEALYAMETMENAFVWVAFNEHFKQDEKTLCDIVKNFTGRYPVMGLGTKYEQEYYPE